ncbi:hypothetical protein T4B_12256 [Trichinella pseudospiralis]|uniref:Uncharacterized protein n=2 Tax=Trichinella pseudospiralis TaxID=6337 RepID=A0A0V1HUS2_TRIPS|nr:hypothetical protein T4D_1024 [Trichinella pseudospiralis]KRZ14317.1 hypothetical protein T4B_12256 [Trichinella pseudospiralis]KRZ43262.1 hypothetical protein T4C_4353 [Trichinella pseudospiralis]
MDNTSVKVHKNARHIQFHSCQHVSLLSTIFYLVKVHRSNTRMMRNIQSKTLNARKAEVTDEIISYAANARWAS